MKKKMVEVEEIRELYENESSIISILYYEKRDLIISSSKLDLVFWQVEEDSNSAVGFESTLHPFDLMKFDSDQYLSSWEGKILSFSFSTSRYSKVIEESDVLFQEMLKISDNRFLCVMKRVNDGKSDIMVVNLSEKKVERSLKSISPHSIFSNGKTEMVQSKKFMKCFYVEVNKKREPYYYDRFIKLIDYEEDTTKMIFPLDFSVQSCFVFQNTYGDEIFLCGGSDLNIHFFNTAKGESDQSLFHKKHSLNRKPRSLHVIRDRYIIIWSGMYNGGDVFVIDYKCLEEDRNYKCFNKDGIFSGFIDASEMVVMGNYDPVKKEQKVAVTCGQTYIGEDGEKNCGCIVVLRVRIGVDEGEERQAKLDLMGREGYVIKELCEAEDFFLTIRKKDSNWILRIPKLLLFD